MNPSIIKYRIRFLDVKEEKKRQCSLSNGLKTMLQSNNYNNSAYIQDIQKAPDYTIDESPEKNDPLLNGLRQRSPIEQHMEDNHEQRYTFKGNTEKDTVAA